MKIQETKSFISFTGSTGGMLFDERTHSKYPICYYHIAQDFPSIVAKQGCSYYGYVSKGSIVIDSAKAGFNVIRKGMYFSATDVTITAINDKSEAIIIEVYHEHGIYPETKFSAVFNIGGPIEKTGRLKYIDGCTDSLLIPPVKKGDPCLNHLHFPPNIIQTPHTHPSHRIGMVAKGYGECETPFGTLPLVEGCIFVIKEYNGLDMAKGLDGLMYEAGTHKFNTTDSHMDVIAFHPDSDFGPEDEMHPMINRTIVKGVSAKDIDCIKTK